MAAKNTIQVLIDGKIVNLSGYESIEYLQMVAGYLNKKIGELKTMKGFSRLPVDVRNNMLALNIADDYFKAKNQVVMLEEDMEAKDREAYDVKDNLVSIRLQMETMQAELEAARAEKAAAIAELNQMRREKEALEAQAAKLNQEIDELLKK